jgi:hypothetical protein
MVVFPGWLQHSVTATTSTSGDKSKAEIDRERHVGNGRRLAGDSVGGSDGNSGVGDTEEAEAEARVSVSCNLSGDWETTSDLSISM